ncbi:MAG: hypothetical protein JSW64_08995 [Candidatus Zixiibacteriota bacterium]|nr:MAG: hypothetical protein JSW64_08995 [candidate division Zixibacteria bacterium]
MKKSTACILAAIIFNIAIYYGDCRGQTTLKERIHFNLGVGWGNYDMRRAEIFIVAPGEYIYDENLYKRIEGGRELYCEIAFKCMRNIYFVPGIMYSSGDMDLSEWYRGLFNDQYTPRPQPILYEAALIAPYLGAQYRNAIHNLDYSIGGSIYYGFGTLKAHVRSYINPYIFRVYTLKSEGFGHSISIGLSFKLGEYFAIENRLGYKNLITGILEDSHGNELNNSDLNFNGFFIRGGISISPWRK